MSSRSESDALHTRARAFVRAFERGAPMPEAFDALAADLARYQARHVHGYGRLCAARGVDPEAIARAAEAPAVPTDAFKVTSVFAFDPADATATFRTSGTTLGARGTHRMRDVTTYDLAAVALGGALLAHGLGVPLPVIVVGPSDVEAADSSLAHMNATFARQWGGQAEAAATYFVRGGEIAVAALRERVRSLPATTPAIVLATSFALVHLLDALGVERLPLPPASRVMLTGGYKGKSREIEAGALRRSVSHMLGVDPRRVIGEYGMTELSSQFWEATAARADALPGIYVEPPWARVVAVDPETLAPVPDGQIGIARVEDLANVDSAFAILTQDRVRRAQGGFELLGRAAGAPPRGCSIALDEMLGGA